MARIKEDIIVIRLSKLVKDSDSQESSLVGDDVTDNIEAIVQELVGDSVIVEVERQ
jgi:hypothetical protein